MTTNHGKIRITVGALIDGAILVIVIYCGYMVWSSRHQSSASTNASAQTVLLKELANDVRSGKAVKTVVVAMSQNCAACRADLPTFRKLVDIAKQSNGRLEVVFVSPSGLPPADDFLRTNGVSDAEVRPVDFAKFHITHVPLVAVVGDGGSVLHVSSGVLPPEKENSLRSALR